VIANTGDDWNFYGLHVSPDVDAVLLLLSDHLDTDKFWGIKNDTFHLVEFLKKIGENVWFNLGDMDAGLCLFRTYLMQQGNSLTSVTRTIVKRLGIRHSVLPMCNEPVECRFKTSSGDLHLEEYWIKERGKPVIQSQYLKGIEDTTITTDVRKAIQAADLIIIGPSNPVSSIGPIISIPGMKELLRQSKAVKTCVSPIIGNKAISGPAAGYMKACGIELSPKGIAENYRDIIDTIIIHQTDGNHKAAIEKETGIEVKLVNIILDSDSRKKMLVKHLMDLIAK